MRNSPNPPIPNPFADPSPSTIEEISPPSYEPFARPSSYRVYPTGQQQPFPIELPPRSAPTPTPVAASRSFLPLFWTRGRGNNGGAEDVEMGNLGQTTHSHTHTETQAAQTHPQPDQTPLSSYYAYSGLEDTLSIRPAIILDCSKAEREAAIIAMPNFPWTKSNRSHQSVDNTSSGQQSPVPSSTGKPALRPIVRPADEEALAVHDQGPALRYQTSESQQAPIQIQQPPVDHQLQASAAQAQYREQFPTRNPSHRLSAHLPLGPSQNYHDQTGPQPAQGLESPRRGSYQPQSSPAAYTPEPKKQSLRSRIAAGVKGHKAEEAKAQKNGVGRRQSVRKSDSRIPDYQPQEESRVQWHQPQGSSSHLPPSDEQDEDNLDPFLQKASEETPEVPPKDTPYQQNLQHPQQFAPQPQQEQYNRPPLGTEGSYSTKGGVADQYSAEQHKGQGLQQPQQHIPSQRYQTYQPVGQHSKSPTEYQAFNPQNAPSPLLQNPQPQDTQQTYYPYQQQAAQSQSSLDTTQQVHRHQQQQQQQQQPQQQFATQLQPQQDSQPQTVRQTAPQPDLQHPQPIRNLPQIVQQVRQVELQQSQLQPPSSHQIAPPSPLQPPSYQSYDAQQVRQPQTPNVTPPQQSQDNMAPSAQGNRTLRKVNDGSQSQPGAPSRESSLLQQPPAQGQPSGQPPVSPGHATFDANVVPTASQGQPYRGEKQSQQVSEMGQATPPPRGAASDMTDDEIEKMMKEHDVLREKYQKVKRYFFEQQTQVHQLQNTLANQRLSLSRTSWDDSEYATRFNRLDGLIAQLSFSIRKDWKSIPQWLHVVVNKTAVETGKQEMTAVGRAFISHWLVENIFDKYFHPDLEPGFSTQLQSIHSNIRRFAPPCHSTEDEESLAAKIINWRLATLEGLADTLRAPQATIYREKLTETLNEKLIASLQMHINDPAPPDLNGGVPMIIELAVSIAQHLPLESREVHIEYFPPGHGIVPDFMKIESGIPTLTAPILELDDADRASVRSMASKHDDNLSIAEQEQAHLQGSQPPKEDKKRSMFGFGSAKKVAGPPTLGSRESTLGQGGSQQSLTQNPPGSSGGPKEDSAPPRVRMAVGVAVQIRGKSILIKAPVYST
ncbi:PAT1 multi-domain protein [Pyrenophora tritici-repentis]|nr:PAT1 multi-domain protein [Pyrenophora tritici-repentis]KAI1684635.1 PAT1 multi-domain protein [Pyrenophora tritici-repentis]